MNQYSICNNYLEIVAGTGNKTHPKYVTEAKSIASSGTEGLGVKEAKSMASSGTEGLGKLKNFITSIEKISSSSACNDSRISESKGNIKNFSGYENITTAMTFLKSNLSGVNLMKDLISLYDNLIKYQPLYSDGYTKGVRLVILEYESAVYMLVTGLSMAMANNIDVVSTGTKVKIVKKSSDTHGTISTVISDLVKQLNKSEHKTYLENMVKARDNVKIDTSKIDKKEENKDDKEIKESYMVESLVSDTLELINTGISLVGSGVRFVGTATRAVKDSIFGIVPLIRSVMYLKYKKKADTILALEQQVQFIQQNINQLENRSNIDPKKKEHIIKKQQAHIDAYKKRAEKLRAELMETEKDASNAIKNDNPNMSKEDTPNKDDDFVLEGKTIKEIFTENEVNSNTLS